MIVEGKAKIETSDNVFYNPRMKFCRDADMEIFRKLKSKSYLDALAATGVRGIRAKLEANFSGVEFNDISKKACELIKRNLRLNEIDARVHNRDAVSLMREISYQHVDIDPFGSPSEFIDSSTKSAIKYLSITATDTSALCGSSPISGLRKYGAFAEKTEYYHEIGLRMLIGKIVRELTKYDKSMDVLISWAKEHYYRVHLKLKKTSRGAGKIYEKMGYIFHCPKCLRREWVDVFNVFEKFCECGEEFRMYGMLWLGELHNSSFVSSLSKEGDVGLLFKRIEDEIHAVSHYDLHVICKKLRISPPPIQDVITGLKEEGFSASRTRFLGTSFKTDADIDEIKRIILEIHR